MSLKGDKETEKSGISSGLGMSHWGDTHGKRGRVVLTFIFVVVGVNMGQRGGLVMFLLLGTTTGLLDHESKVDLDVIPAFGFGRVETRVDR